MVTYWISRIPFRSDKNENPTVLAIVQSPVESIDAVSETSEDESEH